jgi:hypothetical protein
MPKHKGRKGAPKVSKKVWNTTDLSEYRGLCNRLVTHTTKSVNSNVDPGGVRVIPEAYADMPYACVRFARVPVDLDYLSTQDSRLTEQLMAARSGSLDGYTEVDPAEVERIRSETDPLLSKLQIAVGDFVNPRLRQILVEGAPGENIALTPIHSAGFGRRMKQLLRDACVQMVSDSEPGKTFPAFFDEAYIKVGGDKAQNVGRARLVTEGLQTAYRFSIPGQIRPGLRRAFSLYHRGISILPPRALLENYAHFLERLLRQDRGRSLESLRRNVDRLQGEREHVHAMVHVILQRAERAIGVIRPFVGDDLDGFVSPDLPLLQRGLLDISQRGEEWKEYFARDFVQIIAHTQLPDGSLILGISGWVAQSLEPLVKEVLL